MLFLEDDCARVIALAPLMVALLLAPTVSFGEPVQYGSVEPGHSAMWCDPSRSGEGWVLEILADDRAQMYWFTFDDVGNPRWLAGVGDIIRDDEGDEIRFHNLIDVHGPSFGPDFDPADAVREHKGTASMRFVDCDSGMIEFDAYGRQGSFPLTRLTHTMAAGCRPIHGMPGMPVQPYAGQSGSWYDPAFDGQGFTLNWMADGSAAIVWYTFDPNGNPYLLTAVGDMENDRLVFPELMAVHGGRFADPFDPETITRTPWGRIEMDLSCDTGEAVYESNEPGFADGSFQLIRLTYLENLDCPWEKPELTDLYDFEWTELPIPERASSQDQVYFEITSIADDGTVVGWAEKWNGWSGVVRLGPGETEWEKMLEVEEEPYRSTSPFISPDGRTIYAAQTFRDPSGAPYPQVMMWHEGTGWQLLPDTIYPSNAPVAMSKNGKWLTGWGGSIGDGYAHLWKWSRETGQVVLQSEGDEVPLAISGDGSIVAGHDAGSLFGSPSAVMWIDGEIQRLFDDDDMPLDSARACNADCSVIAGNQQNSNFQSPVSHQAWYRARSGAVTYLDTPENAFADASRVVDISNAGDVIVGVLHDADDIADGWLWTEDTGSVSLREILDNEDDSQLIGRWNRLVTGISSDGKRILFSGYTPGSQSVLRQFRAGILHLIPKTQQAVIDHPQQVDDQDGK